MDNAKQSTKLRNESPIHELVISEQNHRPSWNTFDTRGHASLKVVIHEHASWTSLSLLEMGEKSNRQTMLTLDEGSGRALYELLGRIYGGAR